VALTGQLGTPNSQLGEIQPGAQISEVTSQLGAPFSEPGNVEPGIGANTVGFTGKIGTFQSDPGNVEPGLGAQGGLTGELGTSRSDPSNLQAGFAAGSYYTNFTAQLGTSQSALANVEAGENAGSYYPNFTAQLGIQRSSLANIETGEGAPPGTSNHYVVGVSDTVTISDSLTARYHAVTSESDTVTVSDSLTARYHAVTSESDTLSIFETTLTIVHAEHVQAIESVSLFDAVSEHQQLGVSVSDTVTVADAVTLGRAFTQGVSDTVTISDSTQNQQGFHVGTPDSVTVSDSVSSQHATSAGVSDSATISDAVSVGKGVLVHVTDSLIASDSLGAQQGHNVQVTQTVTIMENLQAGSAGTAVTINFGTGLRIDRLLDPTNYSFEPMGTAFPFTILGIRPVATAITSGNGATVVNTGGFSSFTLHFSDGTFTGANLNEYLSLSSTVNDISYLRIVQILNPNQVLVDKPLISIDPQNGSIPWALSSAPTSVVVITTKQTNIQTYNVQMAGLQMASGAPFSFAGSFVASALQPRLQTVTALDDGQILITYSEPMLDDEFLTSPAEYAITGPTPVNISSVRTVTSNQIVLQTVGMGSGSYNLTVNATPSTRRSTRPSSAVRFR
jgi:hypothetical protein